MIKHRVPKLSSPPVIDGKWDKAPWNAIAPLNVDQVFGKKPPEHHPAVQARIAYDFEAVYVTFRVEDRYVRAVAANHQGDVWRDSCAEFFFVPGTDISKGYFNLEMNCGGTMLFHFQPVPKQNVVSVRPEDVDRVTVAHSMPRIVQPEMANPVTWTLEYRLPVNILEKYSPVAQPAPGVTWRANFFKCADDSSHPHWLTWSPVDPSPLGFHRPDRFGELAFA